MPATSENTLAYAPLSNVKRTLETDKAMEYAAEANSRTLPVWAQTVLTEAAKGEEFDVWIFYQALTQAMSAATTRHAHSMGRREQARKIRHLAYWAAAVLEKTLTHMEPVEGKTSPALEAARDQLQAAQGEIHGLKMDVEALTEQNARYVAELGKHDEHIKGYVEIAARSEAQLREAEEQIEKTQGSNEYLAGRLIDTAADLAQAKAERDHARQVAEYMASLLDPIQAAMLVGYLDGIEA